MDKSKVIFRADGNAQIGLGHLYRCLSIAQMVEDDFEINFICREVPIAFSKELNTKAYKLSIVRSEDEWINTQLSGHIIVMDGYHFDISIHTKVRSHSALLVCIDDLHEKPFHADLILNHAPGVSPQDYRASLYTLYALGPDYAMLRPEFLSVANTEREKSDNKVLLICFGGADPKNLTSQCLKVALKFRELQQIIVVTGAAYQLNEAFNKLLKQDKRVNHYHSVSASKLLTLMKEADMAIVPASGALMEALAVQTRVVSGIYTNNQSFIYRSFLKMEAFIDAGDFNPVSIKRAIILLLSGKSIQSDNKIIDGYSGRRIRKLFYHLSLYSNFDLRKANESDTDLTYQWASNSLIRKHSFSQHQITFEEHQQWYTNKLSCTNCTYLIAESNNGKRMGSIRFDSSKDGVLISYLLDPAFQGQGLSTPLLAKGIELFEKEYPKPGYSKLVGLVLKANLPSIKTFQRLGFKQIDEHDYYRFVKAFS